MLPAAIPDILTLAWPQKYYMNFKGYLLARRGMYSIGIKKVPLCPICENPIVTASYSDPGNADLHHALLTREHVKSKPDLVWLINHPCNCVLRHHKTRWCYHTPGTGGQEIWERCALYLIKWEGRDDVHEYLRAMAELFPATAGAQLKRLEALTK